MNASPQLFSCAVCIRRHFGESKFNPDLATINDEFFERLIKLPFFSYLNDLKCGSAKFDESLHSLSTNLKANSKSKTKLQLLQKEKNANYNEDITKQNHEVEAVKKEPGSLQESSYFGSSSSNANTSVTPPHSTPAFQDADYTRVKSVKILDSKVPNTHFNKNGFVMMMASRDVDKFEELFLRISANAFAVSSPVSSPEKLNNLFMREVLGPLTIEERQATSMVRNTEESGLCSVCLEKEANQVLTMCGHLSTCYECVLQVSSCPICRARITGVMPVSLPRRYFKTKSDF